MDWDFAIERYRGPLLGHVLSLFAMIGLTKGGAIARLPRPLYREVLGILRGAESAVRRIIIVAARNLVVEPRPKRPARVKSIASGEDKDKGDGKAEAEFKARRKRRASFRLFDPLKRFKKFFGRKGKRPRVEPRVTVIDTDVSPREYFLRRFYGPPTAPAPVPQVAETIDDGTVNAGPLIRRLFAILDALEDIPRQAMRLARWQAQAVEDRRPQRHSPLRVGRPPGYRKRPKHEVDEILKECDWLARNVHPQLDSS